MSIGFWNSEIGLGREGRQAVLDIGRGNGNGRMGHGSISSMGSYTASAISPPTLIHTCTMVALHIFTLAAALASVSSASPIVARDPTGVWVHPGGNTNLCLTADADENKLMKSVTLWVLVRLWSLTSFTVRLASVETPSSSGSLTQARPRSLLPPTLASVLWEESVCSVL
jgi:hypothetical protein